MPFRVINNHRQPITLESGVILAAAGTPGSTRELESITDKDRRRNAGRISVTEVLAPEVITVDVSPTKPQEASVSGATDSEPETEAKSGARRRNS